ncbi:MAG: hypothetical protein ACYDBQ_00210 [Thermoplasmatota archaeon]
MTDYALPLQVAGVALILLGPAVLALSWRSRLHRAFALLSIVIGLSAWLGHPPTPSQAAVRTFVYFLIAQPFAAANFALALAQENRGPNRSPWLARCRWLVLAGCVVFEALYLLDHGLYFLPPGVFTLFLWIAPATSAVVGAVVGFEAVRAQGETQAGLFLFSTGFLLEPLYYVALGAPGVAREPGWDQIPILMLAATAVLATGLLVVATRRAARTKHLGAAPTVQISLVLCALASALLVGALPSGVFDFLFLFFMACWRVAFVLLVAFAMVRHSLFTLNSGFRVLVREGGTAGALAVGFFLAEHVLQNVLAEALNATPFHDATAKIGAGLAVATALIPVHHAFKRLATHLAPTPDIPQYRRHCMAVYRAAYRAASRTGRMPPLEKAALHHLALTLHLGHRDVMAIERPAAQAA